jgi:hypothetical protein
MTQPENTPEQLTVTPAVADAITQHLGAGAELTAEQVALVLDAFNAVRQGDPPGTVCRNPDNGAVAHRVVHDGVHIWRASAPDGLQWNDLNPTLPGWTTIFSPPGESTA